MKILTNFIIFTISFSITYWLIKKANIQGKLYNKTIRVKYYKLLVGCIFIFFVFLLEYGQQSLNDLYGRHNYLSIILGGFLGAVYFGLIPFIFTKK